MMEKQSTPLVSVAVITYNSASFVLETLDSVKKQSWLNLELIISDDGSTDETVQLCKQWLEKNGSHFDRTEIITVEKNTGIPANCNRAIKASRGEWVKLIAGDDILDPCGVENLMKEATPNKDVIIGSIRPFRVSDDKKTILDEVIPSKDIYFFFQKDAAFQYHYMLLSRPGFAAGAFIRRDLYDRIGYYDERFWLMEDLPFWLKVNKCGIKLYLLKDVVAFYRIHDSVSIVNESKFINENFHACTQLFHKEILDKEIPWYHFAYYETRMVDKLKFWMIIHVFKNKRTSWNKYIVKGLNALRLEPWSNKFRKMMYRRSVNG